MREPDEPNNVNDPNRQNDPLPRREPASDDAPGLSPDLQATEAEWGRLRPSAPQLDRDRLMYLAGWAAAETAATQQGRGRLSRVAWPVALGGMTAVAATLLGMLLVRPEPGIVERVVYVQSDHKTNSTDVARAFARSNAGASAPDGHERNIWTVGQLLRAAGSSQLASDLLPADTQAPIAYLAPFEEPIVLSSRSFDALLDEDGRGSSRSIPPDCRSPPALESDRKSVV